MTEGFEGAEKILQFKIMSVKPNAGLRGVPRSEWDPILSEAKCCILSECKSEYVPIFILLELELVLLMSYRRVVYLCSTMPVFSRPAGERFY